MKLLLTSNGLSNSSIANALEDLAGKPRKQIKIAFIPNAALAPGEFKHESRGWLADDLYNIKEFCGFIDVVSLADLSNEEVLKRLEFADVIFVGGGNTFYLSYLMQKAGLFEELPKLLKSRVYAGISAGSIVTTPNLEVVKALPYGDFAIPKASSPKALKYVDFEFAPHVPDWPSFEDAEKYAKTTTNNFYALDNQSAVKVDGDKIEVISEGTWKLYEPK